LAGLPATGLGLEVVAVAVAAAVTEALALVGLGVVVVAHEQPAAIAGFRGKRANFGAGTYVCRVSFFNVSSSLGVKLELGDGRSRLEKSGRADEGLETFTLLKFALKSKLVPGSEFKSCLSKNSDRG
jgi:hypothetical protein